MLHRAPALTALVLAAILAGCAGGGRSVPQERAPRNGAAAQFAVPPALTLAVPPAPPAFTPRPPSSSGRRTMAGHPAFFAGEASLGNGAYYLALPNGNPFGYYSYLSDPSYIYHFDFGYFYTVDANDGQGGIYFYDFTSSHWWYTGRTYPFPYLYDFGLSAFLYAYPASTAGHYTSNPRYFYNFTAGKIITLPETIVEYSSGISAHAYPNSIAAGADGALWFTEQTLSNGHIGRITTGGTVLEYAGPSMTGLEQANEIVAGPDGNLWFTESAGSPSGQVGRITTSGTITEFQTGITAGLDPTGITVGPDGALWFAEEGATPKIGRITTAGAITEFSLGLSGGNAGTDVLRLTSGPDGALWFAENNYYDTTQNRLGKMTTAGVVSFYQTGLGSGSAPSHIVTGPDGALWFTELTGAKIGRITTAGAITEYPAVNTSSDGAIVVGQDGALWFTVGTGYGEIGRMTTGGAFSSYSTGITPGGAVPSGITKGPDNKIWFTEFLGNRIGKVQ